MQLHDILLRTQRWCSSRDPTVEVICCRWSSFSVAPQLAAVAGVAGAVSRDGLRLRGRHGGSESGEECEEHEELVGELHRYCGPRNVRPTYGSHDAARSKSASCSRAHYSASQPYFLHIRWVTHYREPRCLARHMCERHNSTIGCCRRQALCGICRASTTWKPSTVSNHISQ
ncbi:hypothetical protein L226DRAFT_84519 [Lentinus tigrinus ALCF2SS1-7]|uniref:uncharacterized protein n=1 Tax=Lentinus tigrinus ALCF2SS1-7 TaxID=1328758 RepID=UPI00116636FE|nr:hypothetical protein L226DRAFT_84519 [Lentinus tigrinus ALCF2SS1-7]